MSIRSLRWLRDSIDAGSIEEMTDMGIRYICRGDFILRRGAYAKVVRKSDRNLTIRWVAEGFRGFVGLPVIIRVFRATLLTRPC
ncbi:hypothetical protein KKG41_04440 [Patescibacteria group bacterium]|nr:hypothetical protein [Patescibacteria group bacterium]MBU1889927.1 hypothetical protein [Patescibacteria group bacterium]